MNESYIVRAVNKVIRVYRVSTIKGNISEHEGPPVTT